MRAFCVIIVAAVVMAGTPGEPAAHPHAYIDVRVEVVFDGSGQVTGLRQSWLFDEGYTAFAAEGPDPVPEGMTEEELIGAVVGENLHSLAEYDYFTRVWRDREAVRLGKVAKGSWRMLGDRLEMIFELPFEKPVPVGQDSLVYAIFDPSYYIDMVHLDAKDAVRLVDAPEGCRHWIREPKPPLEAIERAAALDRFNTQDTGLGFLFAQQVTVSCPAP